VGVCKRMLGGSQVMKRRLRDYGILALASVMLAGTTGGAAHPARARPELDAQQTVAMVRAGQFAVLDRYYGSVQAGYDEGSVSDEKLRAEFRHFYDASSDLAAHYQAWVKETPKSYVAHLARAIYYLRVGEASRGNRIIADTSETQLTGMDAAFGTATRELQESLPLESKPLLTVFYQLDIGKFEGDAAQNGQLLRASLRIDPKNFIVRDMYVQTLMTAWGGSTEEIRAFVAASKAAGLSARQVNDLQSVVFSDEAWIDEVQNENYARAADEYLSAAKLSGDDTCVLCAGMMLAKGGYFVRAASVLTQYLARHPDSVEALEIRADMYFKVERIPDATRDCRRLADLGDAYGQYILGLAYTFGMYGFPKDMDAAVRWLRPAAAQGFPKASQLLSVAIAEQLAHPRPAGATRSPAS